MNEAQRILIKKKEEYQYGITQLEQDIKIKQDCLTERKKEFKELLEALMVLESKK